MTILERVELHNSAAGATVRPSRQKTSRMSKAAGRSPFVLTMKISKFFLDPKSALSAGFASSPRRYRWLLRLRWQPNGSRIGHGVLMRSTSLHPIS